MSRTNNASTPISQVSRSGSVLNASVGSAGAASSTNKAMVSPSGVGASMNRGKDKVSKVWSSAVKERGIVVVFVILTLIAITSVIIYILYRIWKKDLQSVTIIEDPLKLYDLASAKVFSSSLIPITVNGQEFTFSMWLYLIDYSQTSSNEHRLLMTRSATPTVLSGANPVVFMDGKTNRLYVSMRTNIAKSASPLNLTALLPYNSQANGYLTGAVEYVPLQRWVHVGIVVQDNIMTLYLDGDMYGVRNVQDMSSDDGRVRPVFAGTSGDVAVGWINSVPTPTRGFMSRLQFFNYALTQGDMRAVYMSGPTDTSLFRNFGMLDKYGFRTPMYNKSKVKT